MNVASRRITFFLEGENVPASRFRIQQLLRRFEADGFVCRPLVTYPNKFLVPPFPLQEPLRTLWIALTLPLIILQRLAQILLYARRSDIIVLQRDLLYRIPSSFLENILFLYTSDLRSSGRLRIVFDVDDAIFCNKRGEESPALKEKLRRIVSKCSALVAGNDFLGQYFSAIAPKSCQVVVAPTVLDTENTYIPSPVEKTSQAVVIGWTGLASNLRELLPIAGVLQRLVSELKVRVILISNQMPSQPELQGFEYCPWNKEDEVDQLQAIDIGIMPLSDTLWSKGKCGFKLIQCMALGIPVVASAVGVNKEIVQSPKCGLLASTPQEWEAALKSLVVSPDLRSRLGKAARERIELHYSVENAYSVWRLILR